MKTLLTLIALLTSLIMSFENRSYADADKLAQLQLLLTTKAIECQFQVLRGKTSWILINSQYNAKPGTVTMDVKQYAEINLLITPSEQEPDLYQAQYSEKRWNLPKKMKFNANSIDAMATQVKDKNNVNPEPVDFKVQSLQLKDNGGWFTFETKDRGFQISGLTYSALTGYGGLEPGTPSFEINGKNFHESGGIDLGSRIDGLNSIAPHIVNGVLQLGTMGIYALASSHWHNIDQSIQTGNCQPAE